MWEFPTQAFYFRKESSAPQKEAFPHWAGFKSGIKTFNWLCGGTFHFLKCAKGKRSMRQNLSPLNFHQRKMSAPVLASGLKICIFPKFEVKYIQEVREKTFPSTEHNIIWMNHRRERRISAIHL